MLLSLFCGAGGLDLGFERSGFDVGIAVDKKHDSVRSYNQNRVAPPRGHCVDVNDLSLSSLDEMWGREFKPTGLIGGPPCQSFSQANRSITEADPRHQLPLVYARLLTELNARNPMDFFVMENVKGLRSGPHAHRLALFKAALTAAGFHVTERLLNAADYGTPQSRERIFLVGLNKKKFGELEWSPPKALLERHQRLTVRTAIGGLKEPTHFSRDAEPSNFAHHKNHWCMAPKSKRFKEGGGLKAGDSSFRSFKTLDWEKPSITVAYGHREVHVHPDRHRRLSVYEAMILQGFPHSYELVGTLSSQIDQVSEAVPPPLAEAVARSVKDVIAHWRQARAA